MTELQNESENAREVRAIDMLADDPYRIREVSESEWKVRSASGHGFYRIRRHAGEWTCECGDWDHRHLPCKHILMVERVRRPDPDSFIQVASEEYRSIYPQDWPAYDAAQQAEHVLFDGFLWDLLRSVPEPSPPAGKPGPKPVPLRTQLLCGIRKVHLGEASRRARGLMLQLYSEGEGILDSVPNYSIPSRVFNREEVTSILHRLLVATARPLRDLEDQGTVAIDSTGFCTTCRGAYCASAHGTPIAHSWVKAHIIVGTKSHIVLGVRITDPHGGDYPQFVPLLSGALADGFTPHIVVGDKAYLGRTNFEAAVALGVEPYIPFKGDSIANANGSPVWARKFHEFHLYREHFERFYHARSNVEATFSAIKRKLGEPLLSKNPTARVNELLARLIAYNIGVVIHECFTHRIDPGVPGMRKMTMRGHGSHVGGSSHDIPPPPVTAGGRSGIRSGSLGLIRGRGSD